MTRMEGELYHLRQRVIHLEAGLTTSRMHLDSVDRELDGLRHRLLAAEWRAITADERSAVLERVMRATALEMTHRFPPTPPPQ